MQVHRGTDVAEVSGRLRRSLLAILLAEAGRPVPAETLLDALWGGHPGPRGPARLQVQVHRLRGLLDDPGRLTYSPAGYCLHVLPGELDAERFCTLLEEASEFAGHDPQRCAALIRTALGLWRGTPFHGVDVPGLAGEVQRLAERRIVGLEELYDAELRSGRHAAVIGELSGLVRRHPLRERLHGLLISALYEGGRQADALAAYRHARETLVEELGLEPGPELRALQGRILSGEPIDLAAPAGPRVAPDQLPHNVSGFVGREDELARLDRLLAEGGEAVLISAVAGTAGVGKTALVVRWAHRVRDQFPDGQLYLDLRGYGPDQPTSPGDALAAFLRALGVDGTVIPQGPAERAALFRTLVARKRLLIVLDNARSADQVRPLLPGTATCFVVVTSRDTLAGLAARDGAHRIDLDRMTTGEAHHLLRELIGDRCDTDPEATAQLIERCARLPLALRIAAERIRAHPRRQVADLVADLADEEALLDLLDTDGDPHASVRTVFSSSYHHLDPAAARLFRLLGLHPGHDTDVYAATALVGNGGLRSTRRQLETLVRASLAEETADHRFRLHDLLWTYAAELAETTDCAPERESALIRLLDYYRRTASKAANIIDPLEREVGGHQATPAPPLRSYTAALTWLDAERANLIRTALSAADWGLGTYTTDFSRALCWYLDLGWYFDDAWNLHTRALAEARDRRDLVSQGTALRALGLLTSRMDRMTEALDNIEEAVRLHDEAGDPLFQAASIGILGTLYGYVGRTEEAVRHLRHSADLYHALGRRLLTYRPLTHLGLLLRRQGQSNSALTCLHEALTIAEESDLPPAQAQILCGLAALYRDTRRYDEALDHARRAVVIARTGGFRFLEGLALNRVGTIYLQLGDHERAQHHHNQALAISRLTYTKKLEAMALNGSAAVYAAADAPAEAIRRHTEALAAADKGSTYQRARAYAGLAHAHDQQGEYEQAIGYLRMAYDVYRALHAPEAATMEATLSRVPGATRNQ